MDQVGPTNTEKKKSDHIARSACFCSTRNRLIIANKSVFSPCQPRDVNLHSKFVDATNGTGVPPRCLSGSAGLVVLRDVLGEDVTPEVIIRVSP